MNFSRASIPIIKIAGISGSLLAGILGISSASIFLILTYAPWGWVVNRFADVATLDALRGITGLSLVPLLSVVFLALGATGIGLAWFATRRWAVPKKRIGVFIAGMFILSFLIVQALIVPTVVFATARSSQTAIGGTFQEEKPCSYYIFTDGTYYYAQNCDTGAITYGGPQNAGGATGTNFTTVMNKVVTLNSVQIAVGVGTFTPSGSITVSGTGVNVLGSGQEVTIIRNQPSKATFVLTGTNIALAYFSVNSGGTGTNTADAIDVTQGQGQVFDHLLFGGYNSNEALYGNAIVISGSVFHTFVTNSIFEVIVNKIAISYGGSSPGPEGLYIDNCDFSDVTGPEVINIGSYSGFVSITGNVLDGGITGISLTNQARIGIVNNEISGMQEYAIAGNPGNSVISGNRFYDNAKAGPSYYYVYLVGAQSLTFNGNSFYSDYTTQKPNYYMLIGSGGTIYNSTFEGNVFNNPASFTQSKLSIQIGSTPINTIISGNVGYNPVAPSTVTAGASVWTYTNNDGYDEVMILATAGGISAETCNGVTEASLTTGIDSCVLPPGGIMTVTWATTAPTFTKVPLLA